MWPPAQRYRDVDKEKLHKPGTTPSRNSPDRHPGRQVAGELTIYKSRLTYGIRKFTALAPVRSDQLASRSGQLKYCLEFLDTY
jgi:hypothetical protein